MADQPISLQWSASYYVASSSERTSRGLEGDKIRLPQSALENLLSESTKQASNLGSAYDPSNPYTRAARPQYSDSLAGFTGQLPNPLMFRLVNPANGNTVYAGIREFSAEEGQVALSPYLLKALDINAADLKDGNEVDSSIDLTGTNGDSRRAQISVDAKVLPKGTYVRLRPLEAGYNPDDWKALLERHMRGAFTTLTKDAILSVRGVKGETFHFLVDKFEPEGDGICVVDTDLQVDIEALNEEQARETVRQIMAKAQRAPGTADGSSIGGTIDIWKPVQGQVVEGDYVDYELDSWDKSRDLEIGLSGIQDGDEVDLFVSPRSARSRVPPRDSEHVFGDFSTPGQGSKKIILSSRNVELDGADGLRISVRGYTPNDQTNPNSSPRPFTLKVRAASEDISSKSAENTQEHSADDEQCKNCLQWVPKRTMLMHENFCLRNNVACPHCKNVFQKRSLEWQNHWHCDHDDSYGSSAESKSKHDSIFHTPHTCSSCGPDQTFPSLPLLARHHATVCPSKLILCQFCHLEVPQEGDPTDPASEAETAISGLTPHERADGARTTDCHLCGKIIRLRDMAAHTANHELDKKYREAPQICRDKLCGRTLHGVGPRGQIGAGTRMGQGPGNDLGLCSICFSPLYASMHDPDGKALRRRIERRYLIQLMSGCNKPWCSNEWCKTGRKNLGTEPKAPAGGAAGLIQEVKPLVAEVDDRSKLMYFCVDEGGQKRRMVAEVLASEGIWDLEWCIAAAEAEGPNMDKGREWLRNWAPAKGGAVA
ncbi:putative ubiquitin fusion degradation protein [Diaporthe ampelina]|uniref:Putative ubiquitin fusion degradation protein n=1 Tax=Diaporthe ampelina TaxID=1214573 RepID=A0A0G2FNH4_9PEZI|nr:putative ubiquitin fusion degradation protein [Diaporthe ampelina]